MKRRAVHATQYSGARRWLPISPRTKVNVQHLAEDRYSSGLCAMRVERMRIESLQL